MVTLTGTASNSQGVGTVTGVALTLTDNDLAPTVALALIATPIAENGGSTTVTAILNHRSSEATTVTVAATPGANTAPSDFSLGTARTLTIAAGDTTSTGNVTITAIDNAIDDPNNAVIVSANTVVNTQGITGPSSVTLVIRDDEGPPLVTLVLTPAMIDESGPGNVTNVTAKLNRTSTMATTITVVAAPGTGATADDFTVSDNKVLTVAAGDTTSTGTVTITAVDNAPDAPNKEVTVSATAVNDQGVTPPLDMPLTIADDEAPPTVILVLTPAAIYESDLGDRINITTVMARLNYASSVATMVTISATPGLGAVADDFALSANTVLTVAAGSTTSTGTVTIAAIDDLLNESDKEVTVSAEATNSQDVINPENVALTIIDDDGPPDLTGVEVSPQFQALTVSWDAVIGAHGYKVQWKTSSEEWSSDRQKQVGGDVTQTQITALVANLPYTVRVIATRNDEDYSFPSDPVTESPSDEDTTPVFTEEVGPATYRQGVAISPLTLPEGVGGNGPLTYALTPDLPEGLAFDSETREISGTPLEAMDETEYALMATDEDGDAETLTFILVVIEMPSDADTTPVFTEEVAPATYRQGVAISPLTLPKGVGGNGALTYALTPDLPKGLTFDGETREISGTPLEAMGETEYALTATDEDGDVETLTFILIVVRADLIPTFGDTTVAAQRYRMGTEVTLILPTATGGDSTLVYILLPFLPPGLTFDHTRRAISGTPTRVQEETTYTLSALDADGDVASLPFLLEVQRPSSGFDGDGQVNFVDFLTFASKFGVRRGEERYDARYDLDGDGAIGFGDFLIFVTHFGTSV